jgi:hypothetical protein
MSAQGLKQVRSSEGFARSRCKTRVTIHLGPFSGLGHAGVNRRPRSPADVSRNRILHHARSNKGDGCSEKPSCPNLRKARPSTGKSVASSFVANSSLILGVPAASNPSTIKLKYLSLLRLMPASVDHPLTPTRRVRGSSPLKAETGVRFPLGAPTNVFNRLRQKIAALAAFNSNNSRGPLAAIAP